MTYYYVIIKTLTNNFLYSHVEIQITYKTYNRRLHSKSMPKQNRLNTRVNIEQCIG